MVNLDGTERWFAAGGGGAAYRDQTPTYFNVGSMASNIIRQNGIGGRGCIFTSREHRPSPGAPHTGSGGGGGCDADNGVPAPNSRDWLFNNGGGSGIIILRYRL